MKQLTVSDCFWLDITRVLGEDKPGDISEQTIFSVFTEMGESGIFCGLVNAQEIAQQPDWNFDDFIQHSVIHSVLPDANVYQALVVMDRENLNTLPVLDAVGVLVGVVTHQSIMQALTQHERALLSELERLYLQVEEEKQKALGRTARLVQLDKTSQNLLNVLGLTLIETNLLQAGLTLIETNLLQAGIEALTTLLRVRYGAIGILKESDESGKALKHFVYTGITPEVAQSIGSLPEGRGLLGVVTHEDVILHLDDMSEDPRSAGFPPHHPVMKSLLAVPISHDHQVYGRIYLSDKLNGLPFSEDDVVLVQNFSHSLAKALNESVKTGLNLYEERLKN